jgi:putative two-component system response regulator
LDGANSSFLLHLAAVIAHSHHERWDGTGYPLGLSGKDIPLEGRIVAVADVFDALASRRPYKEPYSREACLEIILQGRGSQFDPQVVDAFVKCQDEIAEVQLKLMDKEELFGESARTAATSRAGNS